MSKGCHRKSTAKTANLLQQEKCQRSAKCRKRSGNYTGHGIWVLTQQRNVEERELVGRVAEGSSKHGADDDTKWPTDRVNWQDDGLVRRIGKFSKDAMNDRDVSCSGLPHYSVRSGSRDRLLTGEETV